MSWKAIDRSLIEKAFPAVDYAISIPLVRLGALWHLMRNRRKMPLQDPLEQETHMVFAVKNLRDWHMSNLQRNASHYSLSARATKTKLIQFFQRQGARVHCNQFTSSSTQRFKYWVIQYEDLVDDLRYWETLAISSFMHLPVSSASCADQHADSERYHRRAPKAQH